MTADFTRAAAHLADNLVEHAHRDYPGDTGIAKIRRAVFLDRGGHAPGEQCPTARPAEPHHFMCPHPDDECSCHLYGWPPEVPR